MKFRSAAAFAQRLEDLTRLDVPSAGPLAVDALAIDIDFEDPSAGRDDRQLANVLTVVLQQLGRQTGGSRGVASDRAVLDSDVHSRWFYPDRPWLSASPMPLTGLPGSPGGVPSSTAWRTASATALATSGLNTLGMM